MHHREKVKEAGERSVQHYPATENTFRKLQISPIALQFDFSAGQYSHLRGEIHLGKFAKQVSRFSMGLNDTE